MKNFTNNLKKITSRLSARWLIMALMLLVGTSSAWAAQFETNGTALSIKLNTSNDNYNYGLSGHDVTELNVVSGPIHIKETYIHVDKSIGGDFCGAELRIKDGDGDRKVGDFGWQSNDNNSRQTWKWSGDFEVKPITEGNHTFQIYVKGNFCNEDKYLSNGGSNYSFSYTIEATDPCATTYYLKHAGWSNGNWGWSDAMTCNDGIYTLEAKYNGSGCNYNTKKDDNGAGWIQTLNNPNKIQSGTLCIFTFDPSGPSITITPKCTTANFSVSLPSNGVVNKGDENITASITVIGTPSPAVTWSSSDKEVATIDANGNITAHKGGETTITATTTGDGGFCENVPQSATLTVKETPRVSITGENTICEGQTVTLTASITDLSDGNEPTINWYKEGEDDIKKTGATYEPESTGKYYVIVTGDYINRTESGKFQFTVNENPTIQSTLDNNATNVEICGTGNETTLSVTEGLASYSWGDGNTKTVNETGTYTVTATDANGCTSNEVKFNVKVLNPTVEFVGDNEQTVCPGATANFEVVLAQGQSVSWKDADGAEVSTSNPFTQIIEGEAGTTYTYKVVISEGSCSSAEGTVTATIPAINLTVGSISGDNEICSGNATTLTLTGMVNGTVEKWLKSTDNNNYSDVSNTTTTLNTGNLTTSTYYKALVSSSVCPNHKEPTEAYLVTVNPLPTITSISASNDKPVPFEDVVLTATGVTEGAEVKWYLGDNVTPVATGTTYIVTSETAGEVIVKAKAFLNGCESEKTHKVTFSAEDCAPVPSDDIKITFKTPSSNGANGQYWGLGTLYYKKDDGSSYTNVKLYEGTCEGGEQTSQEVTISNLQNNATVYFKACFDYGGYTATTKKLTLTKGNKYIIGIISDQNPSSTNGTNKTSEVGIEVTSKVSLTTDPPIKAPAVKMVSAEYDEVNDKIVAKGAVYKTGCGETFWGFQYSRNGQTWGTTDEYFIRPSTGNSLSVPGEFDYSFAIPNANGGETYYIRAYALNNYNKDNYKLSSAVYSTTSLPVEIPSKTIESATISLVDSEGKPLDVTEVCPQSTVYLKVSYVGGDFKSFEAADNFPGTNLEKVSHDKANNYAIFSYTATSTGVANITISNENTSVTPDTGVSITVKEVSVATPPTIYLEKNTICDNQTTNVVVNSPIVGFIYSLKNGSVGDPVTYESGDLKFSVSKEGSYTVQVQETVCGTTAISAPVDLRVITSDVKITLTTDVNTITPWQPLTLTVKAPSGYDYDLQGLDGMVYTKKGDVYTIKIPRPEGEDWKTGNTSSPEGTATKTFTASIKAGEDTSCSTTTKEVTLVDTEEECLAVGN